MREILFRGKRTHNDEWIVGSLHIEKFENDAGYLCCEINQCDVYPETVGQYTGLTDKNGTKIFEEDIVNVAYNVHYTGVSKERIGNFEVVFDNGCFMKSKILKGGLYHFISSDEIEVLGNIHDNPELLKGGAD